MQWWVFLGPNSRDSPLGQLVTLEVVSETLYSPCQRNFNPVQDLDLGLGLARIATLDLGLVSAQLLHHHSRVFICIITWKGGSRNVNFAS